MTTIDQTASSFGSHLPAQRPHHLPRPRLEEPFRQLNDSDGRILSVWSAAGSGKTELLIEWAHLVERAHRRARWWSGGTIPADDDVVDDDEWTFIDDAHLIDPAALSHLLEPATPSRGKIVVAGRFQPVRSLAYLAAAGTLIEVRAEELAFTSQEAAELADLHGVRLGDLTVSALVERTGGWATGIALAIPRLAHDDADDVIERFIGDSRAVGDFLSAEILDRSSYEESEILITGAVAESVPSDLLVELTGRADALTVARQIASQNGLLQVRDGQVTFHPVLFAFLRAEGRRRDLDLQRDTHGRAALWYAARDRRPDALRHALLSERTSLIRKVVERFGLELVLSGHGDLVDDALTALSAHDDSLAIIVTRLMRHIPFSTDHFLWSRLLHDAQQHDHPSFDHTPWPTALAALQCFPPDGDPGVTAPPDLGTPQHLAARASSLGLDLFCALAEAQILRHAGEPREAMTAAGRVIDAAGAAHYQWLQLHGVELYSRYAIELEEWEKSAAMEERVAETGITLSPGMSDPMRAAASIIRASRRYQQGEAFSCELDDVISARRGRTDPLAVVARALQLLDALDIDDDALAAADELEKLLRIHGARFPRLVAASSLPIVSLRVTQDEMPLAIDYASFAAGLLGADSLENANLHFLLDAESRGERDASLTRALAQGARRWHPNAVVAASLLLAESAHAVGRDHVCIAHLTTALKEAKRFRTIRPYLARHAVGARLTGMYEGRYGHLNAVSSAIARRARVAPAGPGLTVDLTPKELEILLELPVHQSVADIAAGQYLSINTVKTHLRNIYLKLNVTGRSEAVRRATEFGLL